MPISANIFSVDTIPIKPVQEAFTQSILLMPQTPPVKVEPYILPWDSYIVNFALVIVATLLMILFLKRIMTIFPYIFKGIYSTKNLYKIEESMRLQRERNSLIIPMLVPFTLIVSKYNLYTPTFIAEIANLGLKTIIYLGIVLLYIIVRKVLLLSLSKYSVKGDNYEFTNRLGTDFFILGTIILLLTIGLTTVIGMPQETIKIVLLYEIPIVFGVFLIRKLQFLYNICNQLDTILYLCTLEILPAVILLAAQMFL